MIRLEDGTPIWMRPKQDSEGRWQTWYTDGTHWATSIGELKRQRCPTTEDGRIILPQTTHTRQTFQERTTEGRATDGHPKTRTRTIDHYKTTYTDGVNHANTSNQIQRAAIARVISARHRTDPPKPARRWRRLLERVADFIARHRPTIPTQPTHLI